jgi:hypothetical protein
MQLDNGAPEANSDTVGDCRESPRAQDLIASYLPSTKDEAARTVPTFDHNEELRFDRPAVRSF